MTNSPGLERRAAIFAAGLLVSGVLGGCGAPEGAAEDAPSAIDGIVKLAQDSGARDVDALIEALPEPVLTDFTLMEESRSLQHADLDHPRAIAFYEGARLLMALSTDPQDPRYDVIEMAELDGDSGLWRFAALDLPSGELDEAGCAACHGAPARPIWGGYPTWPGALGDDGGVVSEEQAAALAALLEGDTAHRLQRLRPRFDAERRMLELPDRAYGYPNTVLNLELGAALAAGLHRRIEGAAAYSEYRDAILLVNHCDGGSGPQVASAIDEVERRIEEVYAGPAEVTYERERLYVLLGLDMLNDFAIAEPPPETAYTGDEISTWNAASAYLYNLLDFLMLDGLIAEDRLIADLFAPVEAHRARMLRDWWILSGEERRELFLRGDEPYLDPQSSVFEAALGDSDGPRRIAFCQRLGSRLDREGTTER